MTERCNLYLQTETIRHEGTWHMVECLVHRGYRNCPTLREASSRGMEGMYQRRSQAEAALRRIAALSAALHGGEE